jgi:hypothetical protein
MHVMLLLWFLQGRALDWHCGGQARGHSRRGTCTASAASTARANALGSTIAAILLSRRIGPQASTGRAPNRIELPSTAPASRAEGAGGGTGPTLLANQEWPRPPSCGEGLLGPLIPRSPADAARLGPEVHSTGLNHRTVHSTVATRMRVT